MNQSVAFLLLTSVILFTPCPCLQCDRMDVKDCCEVQGGCCSAAGPAWADRADSEGSHCCCDSLSCQRETPHRSRAFSYPSESNPALQMAVTMGLDSARPQHLGNSENPFLSDFSLSGRSCCLRI